MEEAVICVSCPEEYHDKAARACKQLGIQKAFGKQGDMVDDLTGEEWFAKWEAKVVMATVTQMRERKVRRAKLLCISGGDHCDKEYQRQPHLTRAIQKEYGSEVRVQVQWMEFRDLELMLSQSKMDPHFGLSNTTTPRKVLHHPPPLRRLSKTGGRKASLSKRRASRKKSR